jgi:uncharacterized protein (TIGR00661 family)
MATIFYSMSGEGRGHATRVKAIVEDLRLRHRVVLFAPEQAYSLLEPVFSGTDVEIRRIDGITFRYRRDGRVGYVRSLLGSLKWFSGLGRQLEELRPVFLMERPDLVLTDFDPVLPRAADRMGVPYASIDHQHFLTSFPLEGLPFRLRLRASVMVPFVKAFHWRQKMTIISSFYRPPSHARLPEGVRAVGVLLGEDIRAKVPRDDGFLLAYLRRDPPQTVLDALAGSEREVRIYGPTRSDRVGNLWFRPVDRATFVDDLACCHALVTTAGNQLVGEAIHLGKPVLALPEPGNWEQRINGFHLERMGAGMSVRMESFDRSALSRFLGDIDRFRSIASRQEVCGNEDVSRIVEELLARLPSRRSAQGKGIPSIAAGAK